MDRRFVTKSNNIYIIIKKMFILKNKKHEFINNIYVNKYIYFNVQFYIYKI